MSKEEDKGKIRMHKAELSLIHLIFSQCRGPPNRPAHQKCDNCRSSGASCGPNYRKKDDPACSGLRNEATANQDDSIRDAEEQPQPPIPLSSRKVRNAGSVDRQDGDWPSPKSEEEAAHL